MKKLIIIGFVLLSSCLTDKEKTKSEKIVGNYSTGIFNPDAIIEGIEASINVNWLLSIKSGGAYSQTIDMKVQVNGESNNDSFTEVGIWKFENDELCIDNGDGGGFDCEVVKNLTENSFTLFVGDLEAQKMMGREWVTFIKD